jgi:uncharacterized protein
MPMFEDLQKQYIEVRKKQDKFLTNVLSMLISDLKYEKINKQKELDDGDVTALIQKSIKQKKEALQEFEKAGRTDLTEKESKEIEYLSGLLPDMLSESELKEIVQQVIEELKAQSGSDMGKVMKEVMQRVKGRAEGAMVKNIVMETLKS